MSQRQKRRSKPAARRRRQSRVRRKVVGVPERPRLSVYRSLTNIYAQVIDDTQGHTLAAASSLEPAIRDEVAGLRKVEAAEKVGALLAERAKAAGVNRVVFDRGGYKFHGRVKALAEAAREGGLEF